MVFLAKTRPGISVEAQVWEEFRTEVSQGERSEKLEQLMREYLDVDSKDVDALEEKLEEKQDKLEELQEQKVDVERRISEVESDISTIRSTLKERQREEEEKQEDLAVFLKAFRKKYQDTSRPGRFKTDSFTWAAPDHIPSRWPEDTGMTKEELWEKGLEEVESNV